MPGFPNKKCTSSFARYFLEWLLLFLIYKIFQALPFKCASDLGGALGKFIGPLLRVNNVAADNIALAFPDFNSEKRAEILQKMWENLGRTVAEFPHISVLSDKDFYKYVEVEGADKFHSLEQKKQGGIMISGHFANWELAPKTAAVLEKKLALIYRPANNPWVEKFIQNHRKPYQAEALPKGVRGARRALAVLKDGGLLGMLVDQKMNDGIAVPFLGRDAMTASAVAALARKFSTAILPARVIRLSGIHFKVIVEEPIFVAQSENADADIFAMLVEINQRLEGWIREHPEQWFWVHKRWPKP
jgi:KDO2-lipid IV(A) lauroyltransferase